MFRAFGLVPKNSYGVSENYSKVVFVTFCIGSSNGTYTAVSFRYKKADLPRKPKMKA